MNGIKNIKAWALRHRSTIILFALIIVLLFAFFGRNFVKMYQVKQQENELKSKLSEEKTRSEELDKTLKELNNKETIEQYARDHYNMAYPDEKTVTTVEKAPEQAEEQESQDTTQNNEQQ